MNIENLVGQFAIPSNPDEWYSSRVVYVLSVTKTEIHVFHPLVQSQKIHFFTPEDQVVKFIKEEKIKIKVIKRNPENEEDWLPYEEFLMRNDEMLENHEAKKIKRLEGKLAINEGNGDKYNYLYENDFHYVHKVTNTHLLLVSRFEIERCELDFKHKIHFTAEELHDIETLILQGKLKIHIVNHQMVKGEWIDFSKLISLKHFEVKTDVAKKMKSLVGKWIIRTQETQTGDFYFRDRPLLLMSVTDGHIVLCEGDSLFSSDTELFQLVEEGEVGVQYMSRSFIDENWIEFEEIFRKKEVLTNPIAITLSKYIGTYVKMDSHEYLLPRENLFLFNVTDSHIVVYDPSRNQHSEKKAGLVVDKNDLKSLEFGIATGILGFEILTSEFFEGNWVPNLSNSSL